MKSDNSSPHPTEAEQQPALSRLAADAAQGADRGDAAVQGSVAFGEARRGGAAVHGSASMSGEWMPVLPETPEGRRAGEVLRFWFGEWSPWLEHYKPNANLWFRAGPAEDAQILERFGDLVEQAAAGALDALKETPHGWLTLILLLDQFPRHIHRGTAEMFAYDDKGLALAQEAIAQEIDQKLAPSERLFFYFSLEHAEEIEPVERSVALFQRLVDDAPAPQRKRFGRMLRAAKQHLEMLQTFGRYPYRNALLGRANTPAEERFLAQKSYGFMRSVHKQANADAQRSDAKAQAQAPQDSQEDDGAYAKKEEQPAKASKKRGWDVAKVPLIGPKDEKAAPLKLLVLHSFRQNAPLMRARTKKLRGQLKNVAELVYANAPLPYSPKGETRTAVLTAFGQLQDTEHQRCWWNANADNTVYEGFSVSQAYIEQLNETHGPFDGILGFSQGGALTGVLAALGVPASLRFVICISGFPSRAEVHQPLLQPGTIPLPSLHIVGANDILVDPERTLRLSQCFQEPIVVEHSGGHFVPDRWPVAKIRDFLQPFADAKTPEEHPEAHPAAALEQKLEWLQETRAPLKLLTQVVAPDFWQALQTSPSLHKDPHVSLETIRGWLQCLGQEADQSAPQTGSSEHAHHDDLVFLIWTLRALHPTPESFARFLLALVLEEHPAADTILAQIPTYGSWHDLHILATLNFEARPAGEHSEDAPTQEAQHAQPSGEPHDALQRDIVTRFAAQLQKDAKVLEAIKEQSDLRKVTAWPSDCALHAPRRRSSLDKKCGIGRDVARALFPLRPAPETPSADPDVDPLAYTKQISNRLYRNLVRDLRQTLNQSSLYYADRQFSLQRRWQYEQDRERMLHGKDPLSVAITAPEPEPVLPASPEALEPLFSWLQADHSAADETAFTRGTVLPDGRLDLCKQVVGPQGIQPLLQAMRANHHVTRLLLGNNIVGDEGARLIADYIRDPGSNLDIWYIAGNHFSAEGIAHVAQALAEDTKVRHLWLKRNPLGPQGAKHIAAMLRQNKTLQVLDLVNCGILDEGACAVIEAMADNQTLRHLYLCANGLTATTARALAAYLREGSQLKTLFVSCNRLGPQGAAVLAEGLAHNTSLERLSLSSNRLGPEGTQAICDALHSHPGLLHLDLGYMRGTKALGETANFIGDEGAEAVAKLLEHNHTLRSVDLLHNDISQRGVDALRFALRDNHALLQLQLTQFSKAHNEYAREEIRELLDRNQTALDEDLLIPLKEKVFQPIHLEEILSVYRTK